MVGSKLYNYSKIRVIAGKWRGRKIVFPNVEQSLRPTPDRVKETLFNWLQHDVMNATCLDLCAGSGSLGIEALSRGAKSVHFIEKNHLLCEQIQNNINIFNANSTTSNAKIHNDSAVNVVKYVAKNSINIVFLDPPYSSNLLENLATKLATAELLAPQALIYCEQQKKTLFEPPAEWVLLKQKHFSKVEALLFQNGE